MPATALRATQSDHDILFALNTDYINSVQHSDVKRFDEILAPEFYCSNPDGSLIDRAAFLKQTAKPVTITNLKAEDVLIRIIGDFALIHARTAFTKAGRQHRRRALHRRVCEHRRALARGLGACDAALSLRPRIGTAGWSIPKQHAAAFPASGSHLERYAQRFNAVEINSSFYRPHRRATYERWAATVPEDFAFAVKAPRAITHDARLTDAEPALDRFLGEATGLGGKLGPLLFQLPPSFAFDPRTARAFLKMLRARHDGRSHGSRATRPGSRRAPKSCSPNTASPASRPTRPSFRPPPSQAAGTGCDTSGCTARRASTIRTTARTTSRAMPPA